ncbi:hypothetical protein BgiBS90_034424 [Biomphalaria glabrata]|nr:hypothetical protein BgiBS90_034424 [Biomphalaria glabrata]
MENRNIERQDNYNDDEDWWREFRTVNAVPAQHTETPVLLTPPVKENNFPSDVQPHSTTYQMDNPINPSHTHTEPTNNRRPASTRERKKPVWQK